MGQFNKEDIVKVICELVSQKAKKVACDEILRYEDDHSDEFIDKEVRTIVIQSGISELMFRTCYFRYNPEDLDEDTLRNNFLEWFEDGEEEKLRKVCYSCVKRELDKRRGPGEENMTFTERYLKKLREERNSRSSASIISEVMR